MSEVVPFTVTGSPGKIVTGLAVHAMAKGGGGAIPQPPITTPVLSLTAFTFSSSPHIQPPLELKCEKPELACRYS